MVRVVWDLYITVYPKKYAHGFCFAVLCCGYTLTDFPISIRLTSLALWQSNDCPSASKATLMNMDKYFMWIHYERLHDHNKAKHNKTVCIFLGIYCTLILFHNELKIYICSEICFRAYWHISKPSPHWSDIFVEKHGLTFSWKKQWPIKGYAWWLSGVPCPGVECQSVAIDRDNFT